jgi:hypothetical protein
MFRLAAWHHDHSLHSLFHFLFSIPVCVRGASDDKEAGPSSVLRELQYQGLWAAVHACFRCLPCVLLNIERHQQELRYKLSSGPAQGSKLTLV